MPSPTKHLRLPDTDLAPSDAQEFTRCLENAADLAEDFAHQCIPAALETALSLAERGTDGNAPSRADTIRMLSLARTATAQSETLSGEVARFLSLARKTRRT